MFIVVKDARGHGIPEVGVRLIAVGFTNPDGSNQSEYRHTDEAGNCAWTWYPHDAPGGYTIEVNNGVQNDKPQFSRDSRHVTQAELEGAQQVFALQDAGGPVPPTDGPQKVNVTHNIDAAGTPLSSEARAAYDQWKAGYFAEAARVGVTSNSQANRSKMIPWCNLNGCKFQNQDRGDTRARLFLAPNPDSFAHTVDLGDDAGFGSPPAPPQGGSLKWEVVGQT